MKDYLYQKDLFLPLGEVANKMVIMKDKEWEILDIKEMGTIWLFLATLVAFNISKEMTTTYLMKTLDKIYEKHSSSNKVFLMKHLFNMKMSKGGSVSNHLNDFNTDTSQLSYIVINFHDEVRTLFILCSFPESWNGLVMAMSNFVSGSNNESSKPIKCNNASRFLRKTKK